MCEKSTIFLQGNSVCEHEVMCEIGTNMHTFLKKESFMCEKWWKPVKSEIFFLCEIGGLWLWTVMLLRCWFFYWRHIWQGKIDVCFQWWVTPHFIKHLSGSKLLVLFHPYKSGENNYTFLRQTCVWNSRVVQW